MIDVKALERVPTDGEKSFADEYKICLKNRRGDPSEVDRLLSLNSRRKKLISEVESLKAEQNKVSQEIAVLRRNKEDASGRMEAMKRLSDEIKRMDTEAQEADRVVQDLAAQLPNKLHSSVPVGAGENGNRVEKTWGSLRSYSFKPQDHTDLGVALGILDFDRAAKITGARFAIQKGAGALLDRAIMQFMLDLHTREHGYTETIPPFMVNSASLFGTGQLPKFQADLFQVAGTDYFLIPTAEVPVTNYHRDEILNESDLPVCLTAHTPCFRSEAGSYGKDTKGLIRQHQFNKFELVKYAHPDKSYEELELLVGHAEQVLIRLELPFRRISLCSGDIGFGAAKCYDLEVWLPGQNAHREISSCSNFEDFQARRANIKFRPNGGGKPQFVHTLNGSGLAIGRTWIAIIENYQREDGSIEVPKVLQPYMGGLKEIRKK